MEMHTYKSRTEELVSSPAKLARLMLKYQILSQKKDRKENS